MAKIRNMLMTAAAMLIAPRMALAAPVASGGPTSEEGMAPFAEYLGGSPTNIASGGAPGSACC